MRKSLGLCYSLLLVVATFPIMTYAQRPDPTASIEQMKKLDFLVGHWKGEGWMEYVPGQRNTFKSSEVVEKKLGGVALFIEGFHTAGDRVIHHALALLSYDQAAGHYSFRSQVANGMGGNFEGKILDDGAFQWGMEMPQGTIRYIITRNDAGQWFEVGEMSQDGETWRQFFEMTLNPVEPDPGG